MKYGILIIAIVAAMLLIRSQLMAQDAPGADKGELEMLKDAWKRHQQEKLDENPKGQNSESANPLEALEGKMRAIERRLSRLDPGQKTIEKQREALDLLDEMIKKAEEAQAQSESQGGGSEKESEPKPGEKQGREGQKKLTDPSRSDSPATPGMQRKKELLSKDSAKELRWKGERKGPKGWNPRLQSKESLKDLESGAKEKRPPKYEEWLRRYYEELLKSRPGK